MTNEKQNVKRENRRILVIDDDPRLIEMYEGVFSKQSDKISDFASLVGIEAEEEHTYDLVTATQGEEGAEKFRQAHQQEEPFAVAFIDMRMPPGWDGYRTALEVRSIDPDVFIVIATAFSDYDVREMRDEIGHGVLFLRKPFELDELYLLAASLCENWDHNQQRKEVLSELEQNHLDLLATRSALEFAATHDAVTNLPNFPLFSDRLQRALQRIEEEQSGMTVAVLLINVDHFSLLIQALGREHSDLLLQQIAEKLGETLPEQGGLARVSADEFACLVESTEGVAEVTTYIDQLLSLGNSLFEVADEAIQVRFRIGVSIADNDSPKGEHGVEDLLRHAADALNDAKSSESSYSFYQQQLDSDARETLQLKNALSRALHRNEYELYYQPKVDLKSGKVTELEALLRWKHPEQGYLSPGIFIPILEEYGMIVEVGRWVVMEACRQMKSWLDQGLELQRVAVNLSVKQFLAGSPISEVIDEALTESGLDPCHLELEITESVFFSHIGQLKRQISSWREKGITVALDDFGTGYSSLSYLGEIPIDVIKVDQSFVRQIGESQKVRALIGAIISMSKELGSEVVVEGVEEKQQLEFVNEKEADRVQGYYYAKPMAADEIGQFLDHFHGAV